MDRPTIPYSELPVPVQERLAHFWEAQSRPIEDAALLERMRTEATTWISAVRLQHERILSPFGGADDAWSKEADLHFLLVALTRLRRAVTLAARVTELSVSLTERLREFDLAVPMLARMRNVGEHFDDYTLDHGRDDQIRRHQLQTWAMDRDENDHVVWIWLGEELSVQGASDAAAQLYSGFLQEFEARSSRALV